MIDIIKKTLLAGVGATVTTKDQVEALLNDWVERGKISTEEARAMADRIIEDGKKEFDKARSDLAVRIEEMLNKANVASRNELAALEKRVAALEAKQPSP